MSNKETKNKEQKGKDGKTRAGKKFKCLSGEPAGLIVSTASMVLLVLLVYLLNIPNPNVILLTGLAAFTAFYGYRSGICCAVVMIVYSFFFLKDHSFVIFDGTNLVKVVVSSLGAALNVLIIGALKRRQSKDNEELERLNRELKQDNKVLRKATVTDALTSVRNRFAFNLDAEGYVGRYLHVMMLDIDSFKSINDMFGHPEGDGALIRTGKLLRDVFGSEQCYRYGGDEFLVIVPELADDVFTKMLEAFGSIAQKNRDESVSFDIYYSAGYVYGLAQTREDLDLMIRHADEILYSVKASGKNRINGCGYDRNYALLLEKEMKTVSAADAANV